MALDMGLMWGPRVGRFLMGEVPLSACLKTIGTRSWVRLLISEEPLLGPSEGGEGGM